MFVQPGHRRKKARNSLSQTQERRKGGTSRRIRERHRKSPESHDNGKDILAQLFTVSLDALDEPSFDLDSSIKSYKDHLQGDFCDWVGGQSFFKYFPLLSTHKGSRSGRNKGACGTTGALGQLVYCCCGAVGACGTTGTVGDHWCCGAIGVCGTTGALGQLVL